MVSGPWGSSLRTRTARGDGAKEEGKVQVAIAGIWGWWAREMFLLTFRLNLKKRMNLKSFLVTLGL